MLTTHQLLSETPGAPSRAFSTVPSPNNNLWLPLRDSWSFSLTQLPVTYCFYACEYRPPGFAHSLCLSQARRSGAMWPCCDFLFFCFFLGRKKRRKSLLKVKKLLGQHYIHTRPAKVCSASTLCAAGRPPSAPTPPQESTKDAARAEPPCIAAHTAREELSGVMGFEPPSWHARPHGARPPLPDEFDPGSWRTGWQHEAASRVDRNFRDFAMMPVMTQREGSFAVVEWPILRCRLVSHTFEFSLARCP